MKTRMYFGRVKTALLALVTAGALALILLDICLLAGVDSFKTSEPAVAGVSMAAGVIVFVASVLILFNSFYRLDNDKFYMMLGFFSDKVLYENIVGLKENTLNGDIFVLYNDNKSVPDVQCMRLNLSKGNKTKLLKSLKEHCSDVIIEPFTPEKKSKK